MIAPGTRLGPYEFADPLGVGGMGEVYRARDTRLGRDVALKVLPDVFAGDPDRLARFQREAQVLASFNHPHIGAIYGIEVGSLEGASASSSNAPVRALVLELVEGETLADRIARGRIPVDEALPIARQIADALAAAHEQGITHRDLKPANVKVTPDGVVKVLDFGLAKLVASSANPVVAGHEVSPTRVPALSMSPTLTSPVMMTAAGILLGTAPYMSPEQAKGREADRRSDAWAFGCLLFEMLTGTRAFDGEDASDSLALVLKGEPPWQKLPADVPPAVRTLIRRCLEKDRKRRIGDVATALTLIDDLPPAAVSPQAPPGRRVAPWVAGLVAVGALAAYAGWSVKETPESFTAGTWDVALPAGQQFTSLGRHLVAVSPNGAHIVYVANNQLYLRPTNKREAVPIRDTERGRGPFFSPDGKWIGFWADGLKKVALTGGAAIPVAGSLNPWGATWGADDVIVYAQGAEGIWTVPARGGDPVQIVKLQPGELAQSPQLLPGGRVLFTLARENKWDEAHVVVQRLDTGERTELVKGTDGRYVASGLLVFGLEGTLFAILLDPSTLAPSSGPVSLLENVGRAAGDLSGAFQFALARDGTLVYVPGDAVGGLELRSRTLVWVDRQGREEPINAPPRGYMYPRLSPDGRNIALDIRDQEGDIWIWDVSGTTPLRQLTFGADVEAYVVWVDKDSLVYSSGPMFTAVAPRALFRKAANGTGNPEELVRNDRGIYPTSVTRDGAVLFRQVMTGGLGTGVQDSDLMLLPPGKDQRAQPLFKTRFSESNGELSPDGRFVAYQSNQSGSQEIWVRSFPNVEAFKTRVTYTGEVGATRPMWARKGQELFYESGGELMAVPVTRGPTFGNQRKVLETRYFMGGRTVTESAGRTYDIDLDDRRFLMIKEAPADSTVASPKPHLVVIQDWLKEVRTRVSN